MKNIKEIIKTNVSFFNSINLYFVSVFICILWYIYVFFIQKLPPDVGDGLMHYFISNASWTDFELFFNHWGKPVFIILSSPFSQLGYSGLFVFQLIVFFLSCYFAYRIFDFFNPNKYLILLFPFFLVLTNDYSDTILSGLTEPLFNLALLLAIYCFIKKKIILFAIILSFTPFMRSEGQLLIVLGSILLIFVKEYNKLLFILFGFILFSVIAYFFLDDFWWYFTKSPYKFNNDVYGHGAWNHYIISYKNYLGNHGLFLFIFVLIFSIKIYKKSNSIEKILFLFSFFIFSGIIIAHSYFWTFGKNGSMGLTRIATQGMPLFSLFNIVLLSKIYVLNFKNIYLKIIRFFLFIIIPIIFLISNKNYPREISDFDLKIVETVKFLKLNNNKYNRIFYHHPLIPFLFNRNPLLNSEKFISFPKIFKNGSMNPEMNIGDVFIYDTHFSKIDAGLDLNMFSNISNFPIVASFYSSNGYDTYGLTVFQKQKTVTKEIEVISKKIHDSVEIKTNAEFYNLSVIKKNYLNRKIVLSLDLSNYNDVFAVCTDKKVTNYQAVDVKNNDSICFQIHKNKNYDIYIWNKNKINYNLKIKSLVEFIYFYPKLKK